MFLQPSKAPFSPLGRGAIVPLPSHTSWSHFSGRCEISAGTGIYFKTPAFKFFIEPFLPLPRSGHPGKVVLACPARWERMEGGRISQHPGQSPRPPQPPPTALPWLEFQMPPDSLELSALPLLPLP